MIMNSPLLNVHKEDNADLLEVNGITVPLTYGSFEDEYFAFRNTVTLLDYSHYSMVTVSGDDSFDFVDNIITARLGDARNEGAVYSLILDDDGGIVTDCYVLNNDNEFIVLAEHIDDASLMEILKSNKKEYNIRFSSLRESHSLIVCEGPYSWELVAEYFGMDVIGIPYLGFMTTDDGVCIFRCGKSGEFCYKMMVPFANSEDVWRLLSHNGVKFNAKRAGISLQKITRLENPFWNPSALSMYTRNPIELQLQWAIRYDKENFLGMDAINKMINTGITRRVVGIRIVGENNEGSVNVEAGDKVFYEKWEIGEIINVGCSPFPTINGYIAIAHLMSEYAYSGIDLYKIRCQNGKMLEVKTCPTPFFIGRSFLINPNAHSYIDDNKPKDILEEFLAKTAGSDDAVK